MGGGNAWKSVEVGKALPVWGTTNGSTQLESRSHERCKIQESLELMTPLICHAGLGGDQ